MLYIDFKGYKGDFTNKKMNEQIKSYIEKILGISVQFHHWKGELELPFYITICDLRSLMIFAVFFSVRRKS